MEKRGIVNGSTTLRKRIDSIAIGAFDGVHLAHQTLFSKLTPNGGVVIIEKGTATLTPGATRCLFIPFPCFFFSLQKIKDLEGEEFIKLLTTYFPTLKKIVVGYDFHFGKERRYSAKDLKKFFKGKVEIVPEVKLHSIPIHSRVIKNLLKEGKIELANEMLGRFYMVEVTKIKGQGLGSKELVPTLNWKLLEKFLIPKEGVYATFLNGCIPSVTFVGKRETVDSKFSIETHLLAPIQSNLNVARVYFVSYLRDVKRFSSLSKLKEQIGKDIELAKKVLTTTSKRFVELCYNLEEKHKEGLYEKTIFFTPPKPSFS